MCPDGQLCCYATSTCFDPSAGKQACGNADGGTTPTFADAESPGNLGTVRWPGPPTAPSREGLHRGHLRRAGSLRADRGEVIRGYSEHRAHLRSRMRRQESTLARSRVRSRCPRRRPASVWQGGTDVERRPRPAHRLRRRRELSRRLPLLRLYRSLLRQDEARCLRGAGRSSGLRVHRRANECQTRFCFETSCGRLPEGLRPRSGAGLR